MMLCMYRPPPLSPVQANKISSGLEHSLALTDAGYLYAWGANDSGQLGTGVHNTSFKPIPVVVSSGISSLLHCRALITRCLLLTS